MFAVCRTVVVLMCVLGSGSVMGACSNSTIAGDYAMQGSVIDVTGVAFQIGRLTFDGNGRIVVRPFKETADGIVSSAIASGRYVLRSNCVGIATLNVRFGIEIVGPFRLNFIVSGTAADPSIFYTVTDDAGTLSGQGGLRKIQL